VAAPAAKSKSFLFLAIYVFLSDRSGLLRWLKTIFSEALHWWGACFGYLSDIFPSPSGRRQRGFLKLKLPMRLHQDVVKQPKTHRSTILRIP
jgi:hypothetical protein